MGLAHGILVFLGVVSPFVVVLLLFIAMYYCRDPPFSSERRSWRRRWWCWKKDRSGSNVDPEHGEDDEDEPEEEEEAEELITFPGGEDLTVHSILDAPGEVVGKSSYGTLYKATIDCCVGGGKKGSSSLMLLRFVRPACIGRTREIFPAVQMLGFVRHPNLVPLCALYVGPRGEKLLVHPFFATGTLSQFLRDANAESYKWEVIHKLSVGIAKALDHLHNGLQRAVIHGNLKSKNILLDVDYQPCLTDYGLHLLLNPTTGQEMLEISAAQGYKAPELIKMKEASRESDVYSLGVILLEMLTRKEPTSNDLSATRGFHLPTSARNTVLDHKISEIISPELISQTKGKQNSVTKEGLLANFQLAMACCSPSPSLRPDIKHVLRKLEEIGQ